MWLWINGSCLLYYKSQNKALLIHHSTFSIYKKLKQVTMWVKERLLYILKILLAYRLCKCFRRWHGYNLHSNYRPNSNLLLSQEWNTRLKCSIVTWQDYHPLPLYLSHFLNISRHVSILDYHRYVLERQKPLRGHLQDNRCPWGLETLL